MFLTAKETGVVLAVGDISFGKNSYGTEVYRANNKTYQASEVEIYDGGSDLIPHKHTYINGAVGINPEWKEPVVVVKETVEEKLDRIEAALAKVSAGGISAADIEAAILEGVNEV